jgi:hypothetical protein
MLSYGTVQSLIFKDTVSQFCHGVLIPFILSAHCLRPATTGHVFNRLLASLVTLVLIHKEGR